MTTSLFGGGAGAAQSKPGTSLFGGGAPAGGASGGGLFGGGTEAKNLFGAGTQPAGGLFGGAKKPDAASTQAKPSMFGQGGDTTKTAASTA